MAEHHQNNPLRFWAQSLGVVGIAWVLIEGDTIWTPDLLAILLLAGFMLFGQTKVFLRQFAPFILILVTYDSFRSIAPLLNSHVHYTEMINVDRALFGGTTPTQLLQSWLYHGHLMWYDYYFYGLYMCHFVMPFLVAVVIWKTRPAYYWRYVLAFVLLSFAGFLTFVAFPAAPPWLAADHGLLPQIHKISSDIWWALGVHDFPSVYRTLSPNLVAAVPSLHAAYPTLALLFVYRLYGWRWALPFCIYPMSIWLGVVYMGEHYAFDVIVGVVYALGAYAAMLAIYLRRRASKKRVTPLRAVHPSPAGSLL